MHGGRLTSVYQAAEVSNEAVAYAPDDAPYHATEIMDDKKDGYSPALLAKQRNSSYFPP